MKLKQKLARQSFYELKSDYSTWDEAFIAGFDKAKEMAAKNVGSITRDKLFMEYLRDLGEEEVEDSKRTFHKPLSPEESRGV